MKLSELSTERATDVLCELTPYIANITGDKALLDVLKEKVGNEGKSIAELYTYGAKKLSTLVPIVLKDHRSDIFSLLAVLNETTAEEIAEQNILVTMKQLRAILEDKDFVDFFKSWQQAEEIG